MTEGAPEHVIDASLRVGAAEKKPRGAVTVPAGSRTLPGAGGTGAVGAEGIYGEELLPHRPQLHDDVLCASG